MNQTEIILATHNTGKLAEFDQLFRTELQSIQLRTMTEFDLNAPEETGTTFIENAIIKARHAAQGSGLAAIADDSGIEVDFLNGSPGVYSARYSGKANDFVAHRQKLLKALDGILFEQRTARFRCVLVYMRFAEDPAPVIAEGTWEGLIGTEESGTRGFGYDPIFLVPEHQCTAAELTMTQKNELSHRGKALRALLQKLHQVWQKES